MYSFTYFTGDYQAYITAGSRLRDAKKFNNVTRPCILPVPISEVIIPVRHLDLGIFTWMYDAMMKDVRHLDMQLASRGTSGAEDSTAFAKLAELHHQLSIKEQELNDATEVCSQREEQLQFVALHVDHETDDEDVLQLTADLQTLVNDAQVMRFLLEFRIK